MPAGSSQEFTLVAIGSEERAISVRGHFERLECLTRELRPPPEPGASSDKQGSTGRKRGLSDVADGMDVDAKQDVLGREAAVPPPPDPHPAAEERGSWARNASGG